MHTFTPPRTSPLASQQRVNKRHKPSLPPELLHRLKTFPLFSEAPQSFFQALASSFGLVQYRPQEFIVKEGEPSKSMYWILRGTVGVTSTDGEATYAELPPGSFFGEIGILFNRPRTATVVARTKVLVGVLTKDSLSAVLANYPKVERIIRDEGQERLAMQEKRKRVSKAAVPALRKRGSIALPPLPSELRKSVSNGFFSDSLLANDHDQVPGPSLPPVSTLIENELNTSSSGSSETPIAATDHIDNYISTREFLCHLPLFATLPKDILHDLSLAVEVHRYRPMEYVFREGDSGRDIFFIVYGEVEVIKDHSIVARLGPKMYFGEFAFLSILNGNSLDLRSADIRTITDCEILIVQDSTLDSICEKYPLIAEHMKQTAIERNKINSSRNTSLDAGDSSEISSNVISKPEKLQNDGPDVPFEDNNQKQKEVVFKSNDFFKNGFELSNNNNSKKRPYEQHCDNNSMLTPIATAENSPGDVSTTITPSVNFKKFSFASGDNQSTIDAKKRHSSNQQLLTMPPLNPSLGSIHRYSAFPKSSFQYTTHDYRMRLQGINNGRRRSSVLAVSPLPDSLIVKVFQYCDLPTLTRIARVCSRWKQLVYLSNNLMRVLDLTPWCKELDDDAIIQITNFVGSRPQIINLSNCYHVTDAGFSYLINEIGISGSIKQLTMKNGWNISAMAIMDLSVAGRSITKLDLSNCRNVKDDVIFRLMGNGFDNKFGCPDLEDLNLSYCKYLTDESLKYIGQNGFSRLKSLDLTRCTTMTDHGFISWLNGSTFLLEKLILRDCTFLSDKVIEVLSLVCGNLKQLDLTFCCMLTDVSLKLIGQGCLLLENLNLSFCGSAVSDYSLHELTTLKNLRILSIKGCIRVTRAGVDMLLTKMESLEELVLTQCSRVNVYHGQNVNPFDANYGNYCCLKIKPHGRIVKVYV